MTAFTPSPPDRLYVHYPAPIDDLDHEPFEFIVAEGIRAGNHILCGVHRCGEGRISYWIPAHPFLTPMPDDDSLVLFIADPEPDLVEA